MAQKIIPCGGWYIDENTLSFDENKVLSVVGGGGAAGVASFNGRTGAVTPAQGDYTAALVGAVDKAGDTMTGTLNMGNNKITMGATPTETTDVTNKGYVDGVVKVVSDEVDGIIAGTTPVSVPIATDAKIGGVLQAAGVTDATNSDDIITQFNALLASLRTSGILQDNT